MNARSNWQGGLRRGYHRKDTVHEFEFSPVDTAEREARELEQEDREKLAVQRRNVNQHKTKVLPQGAATNKTPPGVGVGMLLGAGAVIAAELLLWALTVLTVAIGQGMQ